MVLPSGKYLSNPSIVPAPCNRIRRPNRNSATCLHKQGLIVELNPVMKPLIEHQRCIFAFVKGGTLMRLRGSSCGDTARSISNLSVKLPSSAHVLTCSFGSPGLPPAHLWPKSVVQVITSSTEFRVNRRLWLSAFRVMQFPSSFRFHHRLQTGKRNFDML